MTKQIKSVISKIWHDPVMSKVIAVGIVALIPIIWSAIIAVVQNISFLNALTATGNITVKLWHIASFAGIGLVGFWIFRYWQSRKKSKAEPYLSEYVPLDTNVYSQIRDHHLPANGTMRFIRSHNFEVSFVHEQLDDLAEYLEACHNPSFHFIHQGLEETRQALRLAISDFDYELAVKTFSLSGNRQGIPRDMEMRNPNSYWRTIKQLNEKATKVVELYNKLIAEGRRILKVI